MTLVVESHTITTPRPEIPYGNAPKGSLSRLASCRYAPPFTRQPLSFNLPHSRTPPSAAGSLSICSARTVAWRPPRSVPNSRRTRPTISRVRSTRAAIQPTRSVAPPRMVPATAVPHTLDPHDRLLPFGVRQWINRAALHPRGRTGSRSRLFPARRTSPTLTRMWIVRRKRPRVRPYRASAGCSARRAARASR